MSAPVGASLSTAWEIFKSRAGYFIGIYVLSSIIIAIPYGITVGLSASDQGLLAFIVNIFTLVIASIIGIGMTSIALAALDKKPLSVGMLFSNVDRLGNYICAMIIVGIVVFIGSVLLIIPGIIFAVRLMFWPYFVVDKHMSAIDAIKASWRMTSGRFFDVLVFLLACLGLVILGGIPLGLGWLVVVPVLLLASAQFYRSLTATAQPAPVAAPQA